MKTPIYDFVSRYSESRTLRLHMPGHKGRAFLGCENLDITEIRGADELYEPCGIIEQSQNNASELFGTRATFYSAEGSSLCIRAMLYLAAQRRKIKTERPVFAALSGAHKVFMLACAVLDAEVLFLNHDGEESGIFGNGLSAENLEKQLESSPENLCAVYITSPDYLGHVCDIAHFKKVCEKKHVPLIVDNAHGTYLKFLPGGSMHPIDLGADMCCDSAHKTLPVLTGGAYLHISLGSVWDFEKDASEALSFFGSTSPSYLILSSLDLANRYIAENIRGDAAKIVTAVSKLKQNIKTLGFDEVSEEPLKVTIAPKSFGYTGDGIAKILRDNAIEPEFSDPDYVVLMFSPLSDISDADKVLGVLSSLQKREALTDSAPQIIHGKRAMSIRRALFSQKEQISAKDTQGRILSSPCVGCPPAVPIAVCGETITQSVIRAFEYYGIEKISVVKND